MECFSEHAISHKDADVREAAKELALQASQIIGVRIERYLDGMSERHRRAVLSAASAAQEAMVANQGATSETHETLGGAGLTEREKSVGPQLPANVHHPGPMLRRGRGRGRGRSRTE